MPNSGLDCSDPINLPAAPPLVSRQSTLHFTEWDLLRYAYLKIGLGANGSMVPGSWFEAQAKLHEGACGGPDGGIHRSGGPFLIWHRAFLYFHERALNQVLIADGKITMDRIRLPYWQWDSLSSEDIPLPPQYARGGLIPAPARTYVSQPSSIADNLVIGSILGNDQFVEAQDTIAQVHNAIHDSFPNSVMGDLMKSAADPIFYAHHSEVDRLFEAWNSLHKNTPPPVEGCATFLDAAGKAACFVSAIFWTQLSSVTTSTTYPFPLQCDKALANNAHRPTVGQLTNS